jgi:hypothetical protein
MDQPVIRKIRTVAKITDKAGNVYEGLQAGLAECCGNNELDGQPFYLTTALELWPEDQLALFGHTLRRADVSVDYAVWEITHGDNNQYKSLVYPGDLILFVDGKTIPIIGEQVKLLFDVTLNQVEVPIEPDEGEHCNKVAEL